MGLIAGGAVTIVATFLLIRSEHLQSRQKLIWKPLASLGFLIAVGSADFSDPYVQFLGIGLLLSAAGDLALLFEGRATFGIGLVLFLIAHLSYIAGFRSLGTDPGAVSMVAASALAIGVMIWLLPYVPAGFRGPVIGYVFAIGAMLALALSSESPWAAFGASAFAISDVAVARQQFVVRSFSNKVWGLPLYYGGQLALVVSAFTLGG